MSFVYLGDLKDLKTGINTLVGPQGNALFVCKDEYGKIQVFDSVCPHWGGRLRSDGKQICCNTHAWKFDCNGNSSNVPNAKLLPLEYEVRDEALYVKELQKNLEKESCINQNSKLQGFLNAMNFKHIDQRSNPKLKITLHSHATLEISRDDFSLLCDPWIEGFAFFGAWRHYPKPIVKSEDLKPSAIWISHEHSDHFHEKTLEKLDKNTPIYVPGFLNGRLEKRLEKLGFKKIYTAHFGKPIEIAPNFTITTYEPASLWNDAQVLIEVDGFRILNINDSGINHRIHAEVGQVDLIAAQFSPGASGYPATYTHISEEQKREFYAKAGPGMLDMLFEACKLYGARYFMPFACHFVLNHPSQQRYNRLVMKNTLDDVLKRFENSNVEVLDLFAGDRFEVSSGAMHKLARDPRMHHLEFILSYIEREFTQEEFERYYPNKQEYAYDSKIVQEYFENLNAIPEMAFCEDLTASIYPVPSEVMLDQTLDQEAISRAYKPFSFEIKKGSLKILPKLLDKPELTMKIPSEILMFIAKNNESWDEATIGYWCEFSRDPDVYHAEFWRILQTPFYLKKQDLAYSKDPSKITKESNLAWVMEHLGDVGHKILARYGLYCLSCDKAPKETLIQATRMHGINDLHLERMIGELNIHWKNG